MASCRSCSAPVVWIAMEGPEKNRMPLDPDLILIAPEAGGPVSLVVITDSLGKVVRGRPPFGDEPKVQGRISHFATCPQAAQHRRRK